MGLAFVRTGTGLAAAAACCLALLAPTAALAAAGGDDEATAKPKPPHLKPLTKREAKRAAKRELRFELDGEGSIEELRCKRRGAHVAICTASGTYDAYEETESEGDAASDDWGDEEGQAWEATVEVVARRGKHGKRTVRAEIVEWSEDGEECALDGDAADEDAPPACDGSDGGGEEGGSEEGGDRPEGDRPEGDRPEGDRPVYSD